MLTWTKLKNVFTVIFIIFSVAGFLYVRKVLSQDSVAVLDKNDRDNDAFEEKPVRVVVTINPGNFGTRTSYEMRLNNTNTVLDLFERLRQEQGFKYERIAYTYGTEVDFINGIEAPEGYSWVVYFSLSETDLTAATDDLDYSEDELDVLSEATVHKTDITYKIGEINVVNNAIYDLELVPEAQITQP